MDKSGGPQTGDLGRNSIHFVNPPDNIMAGVDEAVLNDPLVMEALDRAMVTLGMAARKPSSNEED